MKSAVLQLGNVVKRQAAIMAYGDCFWAIAVILLISGGALFLLPKTKPGHTEVAA
jgi:hypothetical protein